LTTVEWPGLRPATRDDAELLFRIYASTREAELAVAAWDASVKEAFLRMQFSAQDASYRATFPGASFDLIVSGPEVLGRLYLDRGEQAWTVLDIALLPQHQRKGIGTRLLRQLLAEAVTAGKPVRLHVEQANPAQRLYQRLGFEQIEDQGIYLLLECKPAFPQTRLPENDLIAHCRRRLPGCVGRCRTDRNDKEFEFAELHVLQAVYRLRHDRLERAVEE
jgi:ribosomal protein S18 acetylase RimI-like enzyme